MSVAGGLGNRLWRGPKGPPMPRSLTVWFTAALLGCGPDASVLVEDAPGDDVLEAGLTGPVAVGATLEVRSATSLKARASGSSPTVAALAVGARVTTTAARPTGSYYAVDFDGAAGFVLGSKLRVAPTALDAGAPPTTGELFVATTGDDANDGSAERPLRTPQRAVDRLGARGGTVTVRGGVYRGRVVLRGDGSASAGALVLRGAPGEAAILDGTGLTVSDQQGLVEVDSRSHVTVDGFELRNYRSAGSGGVPVGVYVHGHGTGLRVLNNQIHHIIQGRESCNGGDAFGLAVYGTDVEPWRDVVIDHNELHSLRTGCSESLTINGNVDGFAVTNNRVHDNDNIGIDIIGFEGTAPTSALDQARNGVVRGNHVYAITSRGNPAYGNETSADGIYVDGGKNVLIEQNVVHAVDIGIEVASEHAGKASSYVLVRNNAVSGSRQAGLSIGGYDARRGSTHHCVFLNNSLYENTVEFQVQFHVSETRYQNNLAFNAAGDFTSGALTGVASAANLIRRAGVSAVFASAPEDLTTVDGEAVDTGAALDACPPGWACPTVWTLPLHGVTDRSGAARVQGASVDVGATERAR